MLPLVALELYPRQSSIQHENRPETLQVTPLGCLHAWMLGFYLHSGDCRPILLRGKQKYYPCLRIYLIDYAVVALSMRPASARLVLMKPLEELLTKSSFVCLFVYCTRDAVVRRREGGGDW